MTADRRKSDTPARAVRQRILLLVDASGDRRVLAAWLSADHEVIQPENGDPLGQEFDLCLLDDAAFLRMWQHIGERKWHSEPVFLPFVLLTSRTTAHLVSDVPRHDIDEVLEAPVSREELVKRVDVLLDRRARERSLYGERDSAMAALQALQQQTEQELETTHRLLEAAHALSASIDPQQVLDSLIRIMERITGRRRVLVSLVHEGAEQTVVQGDDRELSPFALSVPLVLGGQAIGHITIDDPNGRRVFTAREIELVEAVASQAAVALENARLYQAEQEAARLGAALAEVDATIHSSLDFGEVVKLAMAIGAQAIGAESASVGGIVDDHWQIWYDYGFEPSVVGQNFTNRQNAHGVLAVTTAQPVVISDALTDTRANIGVMKAYGLRSCVVAPLIIRGNAVGVLYFNYLSAPHHFTSAEVDFVRKVASSLSLAMENARLYEAERDIADRLQEALLALPHEVEGVMFSHAYHSATDAARVGGDFYDIFELEGGRVGVAIGDVAGKGLDAAVLTSVVKNTMRAHASEPGKKPGEILRLTNDVIYKSTPMEAFVTVFFGILDCANGCLLYANAGHTTAAITHRDAPATQLAVTGPLLGALPDVQLAEEQACFTEDEVLFLYTDGLTEARRDSELYGEERLLGFLTSSPSRGSLDIVHETIEEILRFSGGQLRDDVAVLAVKRRGRGAEAEMRQVRQESFGPSRSEVDINAKASSA